MSREHLRSNGALRPIPLAVAAAVVMVLAVLGILPAWPGLVHAVALPPLDLIHDVGAILVLTSDWPSFAAAVVGSLLLRSLVLALVFGGVGDGRFAFAVRFYLAVSPIAFLSAAMLYTSPALLFYALFWFGMMAALALLALTGAVPWQGSHRLTGAFRSASRHGLRVGTIGAYLVLLTAIGIVADISQPFGPVLLLPASAALTFSAAWMLAADPGGRLARRGLAALGAAGAVSLVVVAAGGPPGPPTAPAPSRSRAGSIMLMSGIDSESGSGAILETDPHVMGWTCERTFYFSYAGPGDGQPRRLAHCEINHGAPYGIADTLRSRRQLVPFLEAQTDAMEPPGVLAAHSQGVWLSWAAAAEGRLPNIEHLVLIGPFATNPVVYGVEGRMDQGRAGRWVIDVLTAFPRPGGTTVFEGDSPLSREWLAHPTAIEETLSRPLPEGMAALSVPSVLDLPVTPRGPTIKGATEACPVPVIHPNLPYALEFHEATVRFVEGRPQPPCPLWRGAVGPLFRHFSVPPSPDQQLR